MATFTKRQIDQMSSAEYKNHFDTDPEFRAAIDAAPVVEDRNPDLPLSTPTARERQQAAERLVDPSFDPSFDEDPNFPSADVAIEVGGPIVSSTAAPAAVELPAPVLEAPVTVAPVAPLVEVLAPEKVHEYQPLDKSGRPVGGMQRFKYRTERELIDKLTDAHMNATAALRGALRTAEVAGLENAVPEGITPIQKMTIFATLTEEQKQNLTEDLQDPAKAVNARNLLQESARNEAINQVQQRSFENAVRYSINSFQVNHPDFYRCLENNAALISWVEKRGADPTDVNNFEKAYAALQATGGLYARPVTNPQAAPALETPAPTVREEKTVPKTQAPVVEAARISSVTPPQATRTAAPSTGLTRADVSSEVGEPIVPSIEDKLIIKIYPKGRDGKPTGEVQVFKGLKALDRMTGQQMKYKIEEDAAQEKRTGKGTGFRQLVDELESLRGRRR